MTTPGRRMQWQAPGGVTSVDEIVKPGGRRGAGAVNHCMHGPNALVEQILDWRPFDYFTELATMPPSMGGLKFTMTYEFEPTPTGTMFHSRVGAPKTAKERKALEQMGPYITEAFENGLRVLVSAVKAEIEAHAGDRVEPPLPVAKNEDQFLEGLQPIEMRG